MHPASPRGSDDPREDPERPAAGPEWVNSGVGEGSERAEDLRLLEHLTRRGARALRTFLPRRVGFALVLFEYGADGRVVYASSAGRRLIARALTEVLAQLRRR